MPNYIQTLAGEALAIMPEKIDSLITASQIEITGKVSAAQPQTGGTVVVLPLYGVITQKDNWLLQAFGGTSVETFGQWIDNAVNDKSVSTIVIDVNSPGGSVYGVSELSKKIYDARSKKKIIAVVNSLMASAAAWIGTAASKVFITPSGEAGSIGVISVHTEYSKAEESAGYKTTIIKAGKYKSEGNPHEPLSDESVSAIQKRVDEYYAMFVSDLSRNRSTSKVKAVFGEGRIMGAEESVKSDLVDGIATMDEVLSKELKKQKSKYSAAAEYIEKQARYLGRDSGLCKS
jgi:signal peptide peptidase SppA